MNSFLIIIASFISAILFDFLPIRKFINSMYEAQKDLILKMGNKTILDKEKQKVIYSSLVQIGIETSKLFLFVFITILPYMSIYIIGKASKKDDIGFSLFSFKVFFLTGIVFLLYYLLKKQFGKFGLKE